MLLVALRDHNATHVSEGEQRAVKEHDDTEHHEQCPKGGESNLQKERGSVMSSQRCTLASCRPSERLRWRTRGGEGEHVRRFL